MTLRLAYDHQIFATQPYGGISRYVLEVADRLHGTPGMDLRLLAGLHQNHALKDQPRGYVRGRYQSAARWVEPLRRRANRAWAEWALRASPIDVLHETYYHPVGFGPARLRRVVTVHDMIHELMPQYFPSNSLDAAWKRAAVSRADAIVCVSETTRQDLLNLLPNETRGKPISVIHHGPTVVQAHDQARAEVRRLTGGRPFYLYVGQRGGYKNFDVVLQALVADAVPSDALLIAFGGGGLTAQELARIQQLGLSARVLQVGGADPLLAACYEAALCFIYPSVYEGFGMPITEAFAAGCPVVCAATAVFREVAGDAAEYFDPSSADDLAVALGRIKATRSSSRAKGRLRLERFDWDCAARMHREVYAQFF